MERETGSETTVSEYVEKLGKRAKEYASQIETGVEVSEKEDDEDEQRA